MAKRITLPPKYPIPENWVWIELEKVTSIKSGYPFNSVRFSSKADHKRPLIRIRDVVKGTTSTFTDEECPEDYIIHVGEILIGMDGDFNVAKWRSSDALLNQRVCCICSKKAELLNDYLYYYLPGPLKKINAATPSITVKHLSTKTLNKTFIPLPPLAEQWRIISRIEGLFTKLDEAKAKVQNVVDGGEERKVAILHKAFTGKLTGRWRKEHGVQVSSWHTVCFKDLGTSKLGKMLDIQKNKGEPTKYLRNINVRWFGFDLSNIGTMFATEEERNVLSVKCGDLFICEGGEPGRCAVWNNNDSDFIFQKALHRFRPNKKVVSEYIAYYLYYMGLNSSLNTFFTGTTIKHLTGKALAKIPIFLPEIEEQKELIKILQTLLENEKQAKIYSEKVLVQIDIIKKTILARAFRGELGTNVPREESVGELLKNEL